MARFLAYDTLMWDNVLATYDGEKVTAEGLRRAFIGESTYRWGTPEHPCPQIGLLAGDGCEAVLFHVPRGDTRLLFRNLKQRDRRVSGRVRVRNGEGRARRARSFLPAPGERRWPENGTVVQALRAARGVVGTGGEYIRTLVHAMELWGIQDPLIERIWAEVRN